MKHLNWIVAALVSLVLLSPASGQEAYKDTAGPYASPHRDETWKDAARNREVPVRIYTPRVKEEKADAAVPADGAQGRGGGGEAGKGGRPGKFPVIIISHGLGGSRNVGAYICEHLASHGYIVIAPTHAGSDTAAAQDEIRKRVRDRVRPGKAKHDEAQQRLTFLQASSSDPDNLRNRPRDISFVIDQLSKDEKLAPIADIEHIGMGGHSFGAYTGFAIAGMTIDLPESPDGGPAKSFRDPRVKAVVAMSPQGTGAMGITKSSWTKVAVPVLSLTGTKDYGQGERAAAWRREGFDSTRGVEAMLVVIRDATHGTFSDNAGSRLRGEETSKDHDKHIRYTKMVTTAYFDAYVRGDQSALKWLKSDDLAKFDQGACAVELK